MLPGTSESQVPGYRRAWWEAWQGASSYVEVRLAAVVRNALSAIRSWEARTERSVTLATRGTCLPLPGSDVAAVFRAPFDFAVDRVLGQPRSLEEHANEISLVLELEYGGCRIVLGGDLPWLRGSNRVAGGWDDVLEARPELSEHTALKLPHHGSSQAQPPRLLPQSPEPRVWWVTPYNSSGLPVPDPDEGLGPLLEQEARVHLCAPSVRQRDAVPRPPPGVMRLDDLRVHVAALKERGFLSDAVPAGRTSPMEALDPIWGAAFASSGGIVSRFRGRVALEIVR